MADVGGAAGFMLGISVATFVAIGDFVISNILHRTGLNEVALPPRFIGIEY